MNRLTIPRAGLPVNARVTAVGAWLAIAFRWTADVPASGHRRNAVPIWPALAPAASDAARGDQRKREPRSDQLEQSDQPVGRLVVVRSRAPVASGLVSLHHEAVRARLGRLARLGRGGHRHEDRGPAVAELANHLAGRA